MEGVMIKAVEERWETPFSECSIWLDAVSQSDVLSIDVRAADGNRDWRILFSSWEAYKIGSDAICAFAARDAEITDFPGVSTIVRNSEWVRSVRERNPVFPMGVMHYRIIGSDWVAEILSLDAPSVQELR